MPSSQKLSPTEEIRSAEQLHGQIVSKAAQDAEFRAALLADPKGAITTEFEVHVPESYGITVHESKGTTLHLALPPNMSDLSEQELEKIAGGFQWTPGAPGSPT